MHLPRGTRHIGKQKGPGCSSCCTLLSSLQQQTKEVGEQDSRIVAAAATAAEGGGKSKRNEIKQRAMSQAAAAGQKIMGGSNGSKKIKDMEVAVAVEVALCRDGQGTASEEQEGCRCCRRRKCAR